MSEPKYPHEGRCSSCGEYVQDVIACARRDAASEFHAEPAEPKTWGYDTEHGEQGDPDAPAPAPLKDTLGPLMCNGFRCIEKLGHKGPCVQETGPLRDVREAWAWKTPDGTGFVRSYGRVVLDDAVGTVRVRVTVEEIE